MGISTRFWSWELLSLESEGARGHFPVPGTVPGLVLIPWRTLLLPLFNIFNLKKNLKLLVRPTLLVFF